MVCLMDEELAQLAELWTSPPGRYQLLRGEQPHDGLLPFDTVDQQVWLIEDETLLAQAVALMLRAGVPVLSAPARCAVAGCGAQPVRDGLCRQHWNEHEADQEIRRGRGLSGLTASEWAEATRRADRRR
jgi:hypothetical protein